MRVLVIVAVVLATTSCRRREIQPDAAPNDPVVTIAADTTEMLLYVDLTGRVRRGHGVEVVPRHSRHAVATDGPDGPGGAVWIADVSVPAASWRAHRGTRLELERRGLPTLPPGATSRVTLPEADPALSPPNSGGVVLYGASWCGACTDARAWLDARKVVYSFRDVETDVAAAQDAAQICAQYGVAGDRVPVIDVAGRVVVGFDPVRLTTILGEPI